MARPEKVRIGNLLVQEKVISQEQLVLALEQQKRSGRKLGRVLIENGFVTEEAISEALATQLRIPYLNLKFYNVNLSVARILPEMQARRFRALLLEDKTSTYLVAMADPTDLFAYDEIARLLKRDIELVLVNENQVLETIDRIYRRTEQITDLARELGADMAEVVDFGELSVEPGAEDAPVVKLLQTMFEDAVQVNASDVHIEPQERLLQIRFRIDGMLQLQTESDMKIAPALVQRVKLMSGLDISEKRLPQDGRFNVRIGERRVDVRISTMPTQYGESVAMRLLSRTTDVQGLDGLGMPPQLLARLQQIIRRSTGMVLVTGPTGSGKTTTLYAALNEVNTIDKKIITVEDPIEYRLAGLNQVQINEKIDLSFGRVLRAALRQDPDIILVGEMRDPETAQIGMRAALTGHMVFSTLHTRDAASTPIRLVDMGAPRYMVASSLQAVIAQRLVRINCPSCAEPYQPSEKEMQWLQGIERDDGKPNAMMRGRGCQFCHLTGYAGRTGVYEMLEMDAALTAAVNREDTTEFSELAVSHMAGRSMRHHAGQLVLAGKTTLAEAIRVSSELED
ncbi:MAG: Flp pilus assembly complex ATPase component TadA [Burkholderiales bacterium]|nr:Flp pilus assembly complex ATPase component TadA [Burkholderiales bacterium]